LSQGGSPFGPFVNRNHFAGCIGMIIPFALTMTVIARDHAKKAMYMLFTVIMAVALIFSLSRGGIASFIAALLVYAFIILNENYSMKRLIPLFFFLVILASYLTFLGVAPVIERFETSGVTDEGRYLAWQGTLSAFADYPIFGSGLGTFGHIFKIYQPVTLAMYWDHAHNDYLELLLEFGIVGVIIASAFIFFIFKSIYKNNTFGHKLYRKAAFFASVSTIVFHSFIDFNLHILSNAILFSLILGLCVSSTRVTLDKSEE